METILLVVHVIIAVALIGVVLIQRSESDGFGMGSGSNMNVLSGRSSANLMTRATAILATLFIVNSLALSVIASGSSQGTLLDTIAEQEAASGETSPAIPLEADTPLMQDGETTEAPAKAPEVPEAE